MVINFHFFFFSSGDVASLKLASLCLVLSIMMSFASSSIIHLSYNGKDNSYVRNKLGRIRIKYVMPQLAKIKQISPVLALHLLNTVEVVSCLSSC